MNKKDGEPRGPDNTPQRTYPRNSARAAAEAKLQRTGKTPKKLTTRLSTVEMEVLVHELRVHQIELETQNEELRRIHLELENMKARYFDIYDLAPVGYLILSDEGLIAESNLTAAQMIRLNRSDLIGRRLSQYIFGQDQDIYYLHRKALLESMKTEECDLRMLRSDGTVFWGHLKSALKQEDDEQTCRIILSDVSLRKQAEDKIIEFAYHDHLTGLHNRRYFEAELRRLDAGDNLPLSILMFDVNGLKLINDSFGHDHGDDLLKKAAESLKSSCPSKAVVSRIGGDEFAVILPNTDSQEAASIAKRTKTLAAEEAVEHIELSIAYGYDTKICATEAIMDTMANAENHMYRHKLYERKSTRSRIVDMIMNTLFEKSPRELLHSTRVSNICEAIASRMYVDKGYVNKIRASGLVHDIGKIGIDKETLNRVGELSGEQREEIKRHSEAGWRILSATTDFLELAQFARDHHERWDGKGYPNGLHDEDIPIESRIIAVADAYDAMTSDRPYRDAMSKELAVAELRRCAGTQFDPAVVDIFVNQVLPAESDFSKMRVPSVLPYVEKRRI